MLKTANGTGPPEQMPTWETQMAAPMCTSRMSLAKAHLWAQSITQMNSVPPPPFCKQGPRPQCLHPSSPDLGPGFHCSADCCWDFTACFQLLSIKMPYLHLPPGVSPQDFLPPLECAQGSPPTSTKCTGPRNSPPLCPATPCLSLGCLCAPQPPRGSHRLPCPASRAHGYTHC